MPTYILYKNINLKNKKMIFRFLIVLAIMAMLFVLVYKLFMRNKEVVSTKRKENTILKSFFGIFDNKPFKISIGILILLTVLVSTFRFVKVLPIFGKVGLLAIDFLIIYLVISYLFKNKNK
jgi:hypothetical protein